MLKEQICRIIIIFGFDFELALNTVKLEANNDIRKDDPF